MIYGKSFTESYRLQHFEEKSFPSKQLHSPLQKAMYWSLFSWLQMKTLKDKKVAYCVKLKMAVGIVNLISANVEWQFVK